MSRAIEPRKMRRIANILDQEAETYSQSYTFAEGTDQQGKLVLLWSDPNVKRLHDEYRRLARDLRKAAGDGGASARCCAVCARGSHEGSR